MTDRKCKLFILSLLLCYLVLGANFVLAQRDLDIDYPTIPGTDVVPETVGTDLADYVKYVFSWALGVAGLTALLFLVYGGFKYLTSAGNPSQIRNAKDWIFSALLGMIILFSSFLILNTIDSEFVILRPTTLEEAEVTPPPPSIAETERITSSISIEIPVGTILENRVFPRERMLRIKDVAQRTLTVADQSVEPGEDLAEATEDCTCGATCVQPVCIGSCCCKIVCNEFECWCVNCGCGSCGCSNDPCCQVRGTMSQNEEILQQKVRNFLDLQNEANGEALSLREELDKLEKSFELMQECPVWGLNSLGEFLGLKDDYETYEWKLKQIRYWSDINPNFNPATFYCSVGGTRQALLPENELTPEQIDSFSKDFQKSQGEIQTTAVSCSSPIPLGEIGDKAISLGKKLIGKIGELVALNQKLVMAIDNLLKLTAQCSSANCGCGCGCDEGCGCSSSPECYGSPCPGGIAGAVELIKDIKDEIEDKKTEINQIIDEEVPALLADFAEIKNAIHPCVAEEGLEPNWLLLDCTRAVGNIGPGGKAIKTESECLCETYPELCEDKFEILKDYQCGTFEDCQQYNFFCCRFQD